MRIILVPFIALALIMVALGSPLPQQQLIEVPPLPAIGMLPDITIDMPTVIDILADYNLRHSDNDFFGRQVYGVTDYNTRTIWISDRYDLGDRRDTIFHELVHAAYRRFGVDSSGPVFDPMVEEKAQKLMKVHFPAK
jgi:hypothetical protein